MRAIEGPVARHIHAHFAADVTRTSSRAGRRPPQHMEVSCIERLAVLSSCMLEGMSRSSAAIRGSNACELAIRPFTPGRCRGGRRCRNLALTILVTQNPQLGPGECSPWAGDDGRETAECTREARKGDARAEFPALLTSLSAWQRGARPCRSSSSKTSSIRSSSRTRSM